MCTINGNHMMYDSCSVMNRIFCHFGPFSALLTPEQHKKSKFWQNEKTFEDIIILLKCTINDKWQSYDVWFLRYEAGWTEFLVILDCFLPFYSPPLPPHLTTWKIKIWKNWKTRLEISSFYTSVLKIMIMYYTVPEIWRVTDVIVTFHLGLFFALLRP